MRRFEARQPCRDLEVEAKTSRSKSSKMALSPSKPGLVIAIRWSGSVGICPSCGTAPSRQRKLPMEIRPSLGLPRGFYFIRPHVDEIAEYQSVAAGVRRLDWYADEARKVVDRLRMQFRGFKDRPTCPNGGQIVAGARSAATVSAYVSVLACGRHLAMASSRPLAPLRTTEGRMVREHTRHRRQVADIAVDQPTSTMMAAWLTMESRFEIWRV